MKKIWLPVAILVGAILLNFLPHAGEFNKPKAALGPAVGHESRSDIPSVCHLMGAPASVEYRGWPLVAHGPYDECWMVRSIYVGSIIVNSLIAVGGVSGGWFGIKWLRGEMSK